MLLRGVGALRYLSIPGETLLTKCPSVHWQPDGLTICTTTVVPRSRIPRSTSHVSLNTNHDSSKLKRDQDAAIAGMTELLSNHISEAHVIPIASKQYPDTPSLAFFSCPKWYQRPHRPSSQRHAYGQKKAVRRKTNNKQNSSVNIIQMTRSAGESAYRGKAHVGPSET